MSFGEFIKQSRIAVGLNQKQLATRLGISTAYMNDIEHDRRNPPQFELLSKIADTLNIDVNELELLAKRLPSSIIALGIEQGIEFIQHLRDTAHGSKKQHGQRDSG